MKVPGKHGKSIVITSSRARFLIERALGARHIGRRFAFKVRYALESAGFVAWNEETCDCELTPEGYAFVEAKMMEEVEQCVLGLNRDVSKWTPWGKAVIERLKLKGFVIVSDAGKMSKPAVRPGTIKASPEKGHGWIVSMDDGSEESLFPHMDECPADNTQPGARGTVEYRREKGGPKDHLGYRRWTGAAS